MRKKQTDADRYVQALQATANRLLKRAVKTESRICFGLAFFDREEWAEEAGRAVARAGHTFNGGFFHGMPCGRDTTHDHVDRETGKKLYAVSTR